MSENVGDLVHTGLCFICTNVFNILFAQRLAVKYATARLVKFAVERSPFFVVNIITKLVTSQLTA